MIAGLSCKRDPVVLEAKAGGIPLLAKPIPLSFTEHQNRVLYRFSAGERVTIERVTYEKDYCAIRCTSKTGNRGWVIVDLTEWKVVQGTPPWERDRSITSDSK